jgi:hypothetical protein
MFMGRTLVFGFSFTLDHVYKVLLNTIDKILLCEDRNLILETDVEKKYREV